LVDPSVGGAQIVQGTLA